MSYLVMECHPAYAVVLDEKGRFLKVANRGYTVGQRVTEVIETRKPALPFRRWLAPLAAAACACLLFVGCWQVFFAPYGSVRIKINPDIQLTVNRMDRVISVQGLNADGVTLLEGYDPDWKTVEQVSDDLANRAVSMGYLRQGGTIYLDVDSSRTDWVAAIRDRMVAELGAHMDEEAVSILPREAHHGEDDDNWEDDWEDLLEPDDDEDDDDGEDESNDDDDAEDTRNDDDDDNEDARYDGTEDDDDRDDEEDDGDEEDDDEDHEDDD